jgi:hypothetical protein
MSDIGREIIGIVESIDKETSCSPPPTLSDRSSLGHFDFSTSVNRGSEKSCIPISSWRSITILMEWIEVFRTN